MGCQDLFCRVELSVASGNRTLFHSVFQLRYQLNSNEKNKTQNKTDNDGGKSER